MTKTMKKQKVIVYSSKNCARCRVLKSWLKSKNISFVTKSLDDTDVMTDLVMRDVASFSAPILETSNRFFLSNQIFREDNSLNPALTDFLRGKTPLFPDPKTEGWK